MGSWGKFALALLLCTTMSVADLDPTVTLPNGGRVICPSIGATTRNTRLQSSDPVKSFSEISGVALSPIQLGEYYKASLMNR